MPIRLLLALVALIGIMWYLSWYHRASDNAKKRSLRTALLYAIAIALLLLVISGKIHWLFAIFSAVIPWIHRVLAVSSLWSKLRQQTGGETATDWGNSGHRQSARSIDSMTPQEALEILGLQPEAERAAIINAHRNLISRVHPDKGGTDYLASSINQAKKVLLKGA